MTIQIDPSTMFLALVASTVAATLVLLWCYWLNRGEKSLLLLATGFLVGAMAAFLMASRGSVPDLVAAGVGGALLILAASFLTIAGRAFNGEPAAVWVAVPGLALWAAVCLTPPLFDDRDVRISILSVLCAAYYLLAARTFWKPDGLLTRLPLAVLLAVHAAMVVLRVALILTDTQEGISFVDAGWFGATMLEAVIFIQISSFLMVTLTKERVENRLRAAAHTDQLTGLGNRRAFFERGAAAVALARRSGGQLAVVVFDLDRFKEINDCHGHPMGDAVIRAFAGAAVARLRTSDFVARIGGEEFAALLPNTDGEHAAMVALQVNQAFEATVAGFGHDDLTGSACAGVAALTPASPSLETLMSSADRALYEAKAMGRGQVRLNQPPAARSVRAA